MKKEIGGYLELEEPAGQEYYPDLCGVNLGRTALLWLMEARKCRKIYLPFFLCDSVTGACERSGAEIEFYHMDEGLHPVLEERTLSEGEYLYLVNYYGQLTDDKIRKYKKSMEISLWIIRMRFFRNRCLAWTLCIPAENFSESVTEHICLPMRSWNRKRSLLTIP